MSMRSSFWMSSIGAVMLVASPALAQDEAPRAPKAGVDVKAQLDEDITPVPAGMGALFVPTLTGAASEPLVIVLRKGSRIASARTGERIVLPPGEYEVVVGTGPMERRARQIVEVQEGLTKPVPPFFGALRVSIVDRKNSPVEGEYVVALAGGGEAATYGPFDVDGGEDFVPGPTLLLKPGTYVIAVGSDPESDDGRVSIQVSPGETMRYRMVVDDDDNLLRADLADTEVTYEPSIWRLRWLIGADVMLGYRDEALTGFDGGVIMVDAFTHFEGGIDAYDNLLLFTLKANQSLIGLDSQNGLSTPIQSLTNEAMAELAYTYRVARVFGPYARGVVWTSFLPNGYYPDVDSTVSTRDEAGNLVSTELVPSGEKVSMFNAMAPTIVQEGAGLSVTPVDQRAVTLLMRGGFAARQTFYDESRYLESVDGSAVSLLQLDDRTDFGPEATVGLGVRLGKTLTYETRLEGFIPGDQILDGAELKPLFRWDNTLGLNLGSFASLVYDGSVRQQHIAVDPVQMSHTVAVRLHYSIF